MTLAVVFIALTAILFIVNFNMFEDTYSDKVTITLRPKSVDRRHPHRAVELAFAG
jgi:hypothetical protein